MSAENPESEALRAEVELASSPLGRAAYLFAGLFFVTLAGVAAFIPMIPSTPFLLLAAGSFARSSTRFYVWLLTNPYLGPTLVQWRRHRRIPAAAKRKALVLIAVAFAFSAVMAPPLWVKGLIVWIGAGVGFYVWRLPEV